ncbi:MAG: hypothetical protein HYS62_01805 [Candidatus Aenigmarchaeota archaeon]|nr:hypothetical protein [Candidatus Aenigmarchaeota archaeon]
MKAISTVIATILMLMITIALAGTAYLYISGSFTTQTQGLEVVDAFCNNRVNATISFRNIGTNAVTFVSGLCSATGVSPCGSITVVRTAGGGTMKLSGSSATIDPGVTATLVDGEDPVAGAQGCTDFGVPRSCVYRITPPSGRSVVATVSCPG